MIVSTVLGTPRARKKPLCHDFKYNLIWYPPKGALPHRFQNWGLQGGTEDPSGVTSSTHLRSSQHRSLGGKQAWKLDFRWGGRFGFPFCTRHSAQGLRSGANTPVSVPPRSPGVHGHKTLLRQSSHLTGKRPLQREKASGSRSGFGQHKAHAQTSGSQN